MNNLYQETRFILNKYKMSANKSLGQNFLINEQIVSDIIEKKVNMRIEKIEPIKDAELCNNIPVLFCHAIDDDFVRKEHSKDLYEKYSGPKEIIMFEGGHNSKRPIHVLQIISLFFYDKLKVDNLNALNEEYKYSSVNSIDVKSDIKSYFDTV